MRSIESRLKDKLWDLCKGIIRKTYGNTCYTCGKTGLEGLNWHTGHMWPKGSLGTSLKYDLRILRPQCYNCNMNLGGMGAVFYAKMIKEKGKEYMDNLEQERIQDKRGLVKCDKIWLENKNNEYKSILETLPNDRTYVSIIQTSQ